MLEDVPVLLRVSMLIPGVSLQQGRHGICIQYHNLFPCFLSGDRMLYNCKPNIHLNHAPLEQDRREHSALGGKGWKPGRAQPALHKYQLKRRTEANLPPERSEGNNWGGKREGTGEERGRPLGGRGAETTCHLKQSAASFYL